MDSLNQSVFPITVCSVRSAYRSIDTDVGRVASQVSVADGANGLVRVSAVIEITVHRVFFEFRKEMP